MTTQESINSLWSKSPFKESSGNWFLYIGGHRNLPAGLYAWIVRMGRYAAQCTGLYDRLFCGKSVLEEMTSAVHYSLGLKVLLETPL